MGRVRSRGFVGRLILLVTVLLLVALLAAAAGMAVIGYLGRTPVEVIDYTKRRLEGHDNLELMALPMLNLMRRTLAEDDEIELALPFVAPPLPPNPMRAASAPASEDPRIIRVGPRRNITNISAAAQLAVDGSIIEIDPGDYLADVATWERADLTIRGVGDRVRLIAGGAIAEGKAVWVFRSPRATVENIDFVNARAEDRNGAGIRLESGSLVVRRCTFWNNQNGILTASAPGIQLDVEDSEFGYNGAGDGRSHALYIGAIDRFRLSGSYLHHGNIGHLVKSRARRSRIEYSRLTDESGGRSSYELEFPNGGIVEVVGNVLQQGSSGRNSTMVSYGAEGYRWPRNDLGFAHNTVVNDQRLGGMFLRVWPGAEAVTLRNNLFVGAGRVEAPKAADVAGDEEADWRDLVRPSREDYRLNDAARAAFAGKPRAPLTAALQPLAEYVHPAGSRPLGGPAAFPGALQSGPR